MRKHEPSDSVFGMRAVTSESFGLLIAYLIPGFIGLWGLSYVSPDIASWIGTSEAERQTIGGFLSGTVAAVGAGLTASTLRWLIIDPLHHHTGIRLPEWNFQDLYARTEAFSVLIEIHYRYYQFYANSIVAMLFAAAMRWAIQGVGILEVILAVGMVGLFYAASRDTLRKYYDRVGWVLETPPH